MPKKGGGGGGGAKSNFKRCQPFQKGALKRTVRVPKMMFGHISEGLIAELRSYKNQKRCVESTGPFRDVSVPTRVWLQPIKNCNKNKIRVARRGHLQGVRQGRGQVCMQFLSPLTLHVRLWVEGAQGSKEGN